MWTRSPFQISSPLLGGQMPAIVLMSVDLPAPLSPTSAVTWPAGMSRSMPVSACTGPKLLPTPRSRSSGTSLASPAPDGTRSAGAVRVPSAELSVTTAASPPGCKGSSSSSRDTVLRAVRLERARAQLRCWHELVLDDRGVHVLRRDPFRREQDRGHVGAGVDVLRRAADQGRWRRDARPQVH